MRKRERNEEGLSLTSAVGVKIKGVGRGWWGWVAGPMQRPWEGSDQECQGAPGWGRGWRRKGIRGGSVWKRRRLFLECEGR